jgi:hypothetical protein
MYIPATTKKSEKLCRRKSNLENQAVIGKKRPVKLGKQEQTMSLSLANFTSSSENCENFYKAPLDGALYN